MATAALPHPLSDQLHEVAALALGRVTHHRSLREALTHHFLANGKQARARLALRAGAALGLDLGVALDWAVACELLHNASLLHDDWIDGDETRRGLPTVWRRFGADQAILAGDLLLGEAFAAAAGVDAEPARVVPLVAAVSVAVSRTIRGAAAEGARPAAPNFSLALYERTVADKTGALLALPVEGALILAGRPAKEQAAARTALAAFGAAYQIEDDLADLLGRKEGRAAGSGLRRGLVDAPAAHYGRHAGPDERARLAAFFAAKRRTPAEVAEWRERIASSIAVDHCLEHVRTLSTRGRSALSQLPPAVREAILDVLGAHLVGRVKR